MTDPRALFMIGVAAELAGMHPQTLRLYERRGLLTPTRSRGGTRMYSFADVERLRRIQAMSEAGHNLIGIERVMDLESALEQAMDRMRVLEAQMIEQAEQAMTQLESMRRSLSTDIVLVSRSGPPAPIINPVIQRGWKRYGS